MKRKYGLWLGILFIGMLFVGAGKGVAAEFTNDEIDRIHEIQKNYKTVKAGEAKTYEDLFINLPQVGPAIFDTGVYKAEVNQNTVDYLNYLRNLAGIDPVNYNEEYSKLVQKTAVAMAATQKIGHNLGEIATKPENMSEEFWNDAVKGAEQSLSRSNFYRSNHQIIDGQIIDSGVSSLGHRSWMFNTSMKDFGFGTAKTYDGRYDWYYNAFHIVDNSITPSFEKAIYAWPGPGVQPTNAPYSNVWSIGVNWNVTGVYINQVVVAVINVETGEEQKFNYTGTEKPLSIYQGAGYSTALIFIPSVPRTDGAKYKVKVTGLTNGKILEYDVNFFDINEEYTKKIDVEKIEFEDKEVTIKPGDKKKLNVKVSPENATDKELIWSSSNNSVVRVNSEGEIEGVAEGTAKISVATKDGKIRSEINVKVHLVNDSFETAKEITQDIDVKVDNNLYGKYYKFTAQQNESYTISAIRNSSAQYGPYFTIYNDQKKSIKSLRAEWGVVRNVVLEKGKTYYLQLDQRYTPAMTQFALQSFTHMIVKGDNSNYLQVGDNTNLIVTDNYNRPISSELLEFTDSNSKITQTDNEGKVTGLAIGSAGVKVKYKNVDFINDYSVGICVTDRYGYTRMSLSLDKNHVGPNSSVQLTIKNDLGKDVDFNDVTLISQNPEIASIDKAGKIKTHKSGTVTFEAKHDSENIVTQKIILYVLGEDKNYSFDTAKEIKQDEVIDVDSNVFVKYYKFTAQQNNPYAITMKKNSSKQHGPYFTVYNEQKRSIKAGNAEWGRFPSITLEEGKVYYLALNQQTYDVKQIILQSSSSLFVTTNNSTVKTGKSTKLTVTDEYNRPIPTEFLDFTDSNPNITQTDEDGNIVGLTAGYSTIIVKHKYDDFARGALNYKEQKVTINVVN